MNCLVMCCSSAAVIQQHKFNLCKTWLFDHRTGELIREDIMECMLVLYFLARHKCAMGCKSLIKLKRCEWTELQP